VGIIATPIFEQDINKPLKITFKFLVPEFKVPPYDWDYNKPIFINGTDGSQQIIYPDLTDPIFPGFEDRYGGTFGTSGISVNFVSEVIRLESQLFQADQGFNNIKKFTQFYDYVVGDTDLLEFVRMFRFSIDNRTWSDWKFLTVDNINSYLEYFEPIIYLQFRYDAIDLKNKNFNDEFIVDKPDSQGWQSVFSDNVQFVFDRDYPEFGDIKYSIGLGKDGDYFLNTETNKLYGPKTNGLWGSPIVWQKNNDNSYNPTWVNDNIIENAIKGAYEPTNEYNLNQFDIRFGKDDLDTAEYRIPEKDDKIFLNPLFQNIKLIGVETIKINYTPRLISPTYVPRLFLEELCLFYELEEVEKPVACLDNIGDKLILSPPFLIKAYSFDDFCLDVTGLTEERYLEVYFRWSNNSRAWSQWDFLTKENLECLKVDPLSFFYIEFSFIRGGIDNTGQICICDLILIGDYENVTDNYNKLGKYGLRSDCNYGENPNNDNLSPNNDVCSTDIPEEWKENNDVNCDNNPTFKPYDFNRSLGLYDKLADDVNNLFAWEVDYYKTDPDTNGRDTVIHEYQIFNVVDQQKLKVLVPDNQFPDNTILFNQFDLSLFDTFEIHITKREFHRKFGLDRRPDKRDFLFFCQMNRMYQIEHTQAYKEFMNSSIYYKVVLKKYQDRKNIDNRLYKDPLEDLLINNSTEKLFGDLVEDEIKKVSHKEMLENSTEKEYVPVEPHIDNDIIIENDQKPKSIDKPQPIQLKVFVKSIKEDLQNGPNIISKYYYDLSNRVGQDAIIYQRVDNTIKKGKNRAFSCWFNIQKYVPNQQYNLIDNFNTVLNNGYKIYFIDGNIKIQWFDQIFDVSVSIREKCWYGIIVNFNQRQEKLDLVIYTIKPNPFASSTELDLVQEESFGLIPVMFEGDLTLRLKGSNMKYSNLRLFNDIIPTDKYQKLLNQYIVVDTTKLILADNAERRIISPKNSF